jgi:hypothetical protein
MRGAVSQRLQAEALPGVKERRRVREGGTGRWVGLHPDRCGEGRGRVSERVGPGIPEQVVRRLCVARVREGHEAGDHENGAPVHVHFYGWPRIDVGVRRKGGHSGASRRRTAGPTAVQDPRGNTTEPPGIRSVLVVI